MSLERDRAALAEMLRAAMKIELTTIPLYATACYTISEVGDYARISPAEANAEPREVIRQVMLEEMLHLSLAGNILNAIGGGVILDRAEAIPAYPCAILPSGKGPVARLRRFSKDQVRLFREIERAPANFEKVKDGDWRKAETIGGFYHCVELALDAIVKAHGEKAVFTGDPSWQIGPEHYWGAGGEMIPVTGLKCARRALDMIVEEGEGADLGGRAGDGDPIPGGGGEDVAHFFKFNEILLARRYRPDDRIGHPPTGGDLVTDWSAVHPMRDDPRAEECANLPEIEARMLAFDRLYTDFLLTLHAAFNGAPERLRESAPTMIAMARAAEALVRIPVNAAGETAGPGWTFRA
ncbi:MAG: ferritin-like domain-containing protein [Pikeienuella sp.]|uniref:ferritin-like domain-containing protein n=1 Tax=Pikeienuella sp. TaxID=2831957 RepID=UPI00391B1158